MLYAYGRENQLLAARGRGAGADRRRAREHSAWPWARMRSAISRGSTWAIACAASARICPSDPRYYRVADMLVEAGRLGQKSGPRRLPLCAGQAPPARAVGARPGSRGDDRRRGGATRHRAARRLRRGDPGALPVRADQRGRAAARARVSPRAPATSTPSGATATVSRAFAAARCSMPIRSAAPRCFGGSASSAETHGREYWTPAPLLEEIGAAGETFQAWQARRAAAAGAS